jgi:phosphoserine phosphatase RsbU/P
MCAASRSSWDWLQLASLGEQLRSEDSLSAQRDRIAAMTNRLIEGRVEVWLQEVSFACPIGRMSIYSRHNPSSEGMKRAIKSGKLAKKNGKGKKTTASHSTFAAIPLEDQGITLGALQVTRPKGPEFSSDELHLLQGLGQIVSVNLFASHRAEVEQFRLRQLNLVREVSAQIANVLDLNELAAQVTKLIQKTFNYYYVAFFTLEPNPMHSSFAPARLHRERESAKPPLRSRSGDRVRV